MKKMALAEEIAGMMAKKTDEGGEEAEGGGGERVNADFKL